jgi:hypothetical protein
MFFFIVIGINFEFMFRNIMTFFLTVITPLFFGCIIYLLPGYLNFVGVNFDNYIPDFLWSFSLFSILHFFKIPSEVLFFRIATALLLSFLFEFSQWLFVFGTFDYIDLLCYALGILASYLFRGIKS